MKAEANDVTKGRPSRRNILEVALLGGAGVLLAGGGMAASLTEAVASRGKATGSQNLAASGQRVGSLYMVIATPDMLGTSDMPAYIPAYASVPSNATVRVEIVNFDDATPLVGGLAVFSKVSGTVGNTITVVPLDPKHPNVVGDGAVLSALDPQNGVGHTFTIAELGLNVPVAPKARTIFTMQTGDPGSYAWRCNDPCGSGGAGWGGAMATPGYMMGKLTVE